MTLKQEKIPYLGALDDETPIYRTWQCQTLKSEAKQAPQSMIPGGGGTKRGTLENDYGSRRSR